MSDIFNDYNAQGYRVTITGSRSSRAEDNAILYNLRFKFGARIALISDQGLVNAYDEFALSDMFGGNDEHFLEFLDNYEAAK